MQLIHSLKSRRDDEEGFTLIELMVVVLIIAILIAIAIPTFLGARQRAQDRAAQSDLRNALTAEKTFYTDGESYTNDATALGSIEPSLKWGTNNATGPVVTWAAATSGTVCIERASKSGKVFAIADISTGTGAGTHYHTGAGSCAGGGYDTWGQNGW